MCMKWLRYDACFPLDSVARLLFPAGDSFVLLLLPAGDSFVLLLLPAGDSVASASQIKVRLRQAVGANLPPAGWI